MNHLNSVLIEGYLVDDFETKEFDNGSKLCTFTIASKRYFNQDNEKKPELSFFNIEVWSRTADLCIDALSKGGGVRVVGRLKQDGHGVKIVGEHVEFKPSLD